MSKLLTRVRKLETKWKDSHGLVPHSEEWFDYWGNKLDRALDGEDVDLTGMTLEFLDALLERSEEAA